MIASSGDIPEGSPSAARDPFSSLGRDDKLASSLFVSASAGRSSLLASQGANAWSSVETVPQPLPRTRRLKLQAQDAATLDRIIGESVDTETSGSAGATAGGDERKLRSIPIHAKGTSRAVFGTDPARAMLAQERGPT